MGTNFESLSLITCKPVLNPYSRQLVDRLSELAPWKDVKEKLTLHAGDQIEISKISEATRPIVIFVQLKIRIRGKLLMDHLQFLAFRRLLSN